MFALLALLVCLFIVNTNDYILIENAVHAGCTPTRLLRNATFCQNLDRLSSNINMRNLAALLLLCGDISLNPGPINLGLANCRSVRNKGPMLADIVSNHSLDIVALVETHIRPNDTDNMLSSITPPTYKLCHRPRTKGLGGVLASLLKLSSTQNC